MTDPCSPSAAAERLATILEGRAYTQNQHETTAGMEEQEKSAMNAQSLEKAKSDGVKSASCNENEVMQSYSTSTPSVLPVARTSQLASDVPQAHPQAQPQAQQQQLQQPDTFMSKAEKQLRTVLFRLVHELDMLNFESMPHDVPSVHNIFVDARTGALSLKSVGPQFDTVHLVSYGHPSAAWPPEICLQWLEEHHTLTINQQKQTSSSESDIISTRDRPISIPLAKADTWAIGVLICELFGVELPWANIGTGKSVSYLPDFIVQWGINHIDESLGALSLHRRLQEALTPSLSNFVLECLWVSSARRPSIREMKMHPFFTKVTVSRTVRGKWVQPPVMRVYQYRNKLGGDRAPVLNAALLPDGHALEEAQRELDFLTGSGSNEDFLCTPLSRRIIATNTDSKAKEMRNSSATDCDGDNATAGSLAIPDNTRVLPTIFKMQLTCCSAAYAHNGQAVSSIYCGAADDLFKETPKIMSSIHRVVALQEHVTAAALRKDISEAVARITTDVDETNFISQQSNIVLGRRETNEEDMEDKVKKECNGSKEIPIDVVIDNLTTPNASSVLLTNRLDSKTKRLLAQIIITEGSPPQLRGSIWSLLLSISPCIAKWRYAGCLRRARRVATNQVIMRSQKESRAAIQLLRQLAKDIPRCHAYHARLKSKPYPESLRNVLLAWTLAERPRMYWQGLDSICAPLLLLHKCNEAQTFACLEGLISHFLSDIFVLNNHLALQERLLGLQHIVSFLDPRLSNHLRDIGVTPNLYAISWFLTLFAHVLHIDLVLEVWDVLLGLAHISSSPGKVAYCACGLPVLFAAVLLSRLRSYIFPEDFAGTTVFLSRLPCPLSEIVRDVLHSLPLVFRLVPRSVLQLNDPHGSGSEVDITDNNKSDEKATIRMSLRAQFVEETKYERSPRIQPREVLAGPMFDRSLIVDVRLAEAFARVHILGSINIPLSTDRVHACRMVVAQRVQLGALFVMVLGEDTESAAIFSGALVDHEVTMVLSIGTSAKVMFEQADSSILVRSKRKDTGNVEEKPKNR